MQPRIFVLTSWIVATVHADLVLTSYENGVMGAPGATSRTSTVSVPPFDNVSPRSFVFSGTLTPPRTELMTFTARASGVLRVFVDDHLVLDDSGQGCNRSIVGWAAWPANAGDTVPLLVEFSYLNASCAPALELSWAGNFTTTSIIPAEALGDPPDGGPRAALAALRDRLYEPSVPWQTYYAPSMTAHTLQPTGAVLHLTLGTVNGSARIGDIRVFPELEPAWVRAGGHSYNGSDYTAVHISRWRPTAGPHTASPYNATVSIFTTTVSALGGPCNGTTGRGGPRCDLVVVAACEGSDCELLSMIASVGYAWTGSGSVVGNATTIEAEPDGFAPVCVLASTPTLATEHSVASPEIRLPFVTRADLPWPGTGGGFDLAVAVLNTGARTMVSDAIALVAAARIRYDAGASRFDNGTARLYEPMRAILAWNTLYSHFTHVYTPVTRNWYPNEDSIGTFVWDVFFAAVMFSTDADDPRARDLACANTVTTILSRTMSGMVPNYISGATGTYDRTEPALGSWAVRVLRDRLGVEWLAELLLPSLVGWNDWFHAHRRNGGVLAAGGADGLADVISLGSDATSPPGRDTPHTLAAARYESGLDNSPQYDGDDGQCSGAVCPCTFNATTSLMNLYDVAFTSYHILDADSLVLLAGRLNRSDVVTRMMDRSRRAAAALNANMWTGSTYANVLTNGTVVPRWSPTVFSPMLAGVVSRSRIESMLAMLGDPEVFCVNASHYGSGGAQGVMLLNFGVAGTSNAVSCVTDQCIVDAVLAHTGITPSLEAIVQMPDTGGTTVNLTLFEGPDGEHVLATAACAPSDEFKPVRVEAACYAEADSLATQPIILWRSTNTTPATYATCGSAACNRTASAAGLRPLAEPMCFGGSVETPMDWPCAVPLPAIGRSDAAFGDQNYWRGRAWAPQAFLVWLGLQRYADVPVAVASRRTLASMASRAFMRQLDLFGQVNENLDGLLGLGSDSSRADSYYHWGALNAFLSLVERGAYPADVLVTLAAAGESDGDSD